MDLFSYVHPQLPLNDCCYKAFAYILSNYLLTSCVVQRVLSCLGYEHFEHHLQQFSCEGLFQNSSLLNSLVSHAFVIKPENPLPRPRL